MSDYTEWLNLASIIALLYFLMNVCWIINKKFSFPCHFFFFIHIFISSTWQVIQEFEHFVSPFNVELILGPLAMG